MIVKRDGEFVYNVPVPTAKKAGIGALFTDTRDGTVYVSDGNKWVKLREVDKEKDS